MGFLYLEHIELSVDHLHPKLGFNHWWSDYLAYEKKSPPQLEYFTIRKLWIIRKYPHYYKFQIIQLLNNAYCENTTNLANEAFSLEQDLIYLTSL